MSGEVVLEMNNIKKVFGKVVALSGVNLKVKKGQVHTLLGENGAGKSTLMKILSGVHQPDGGEIILKGERVRFQSPMDAQSRGISIIYQELSLCQNLSIAENIFANREPVKGLFINDREMNRAARDILDQIEMDISPTTLVKELSISQKQMVEIAKALSMNSEIIIMDEPTSALSSRETEVLFRIIEKLKETGVAIIYISHRMDELLRISDEITVMRDGNYIGTVKKSEADINSLIRMMVGRELKDIYPKRDYEIGSETLLEVEGYTKKGLFDDIHLKLRRGEILGIFGLVGAGRTDVAKAIFGITTPDAGTIKVKGNQVKITKPQDAIKHKIAFITENRREQGLVITDTVKRNISMVSIDTLLSKIGLLNEKTENAMAEKAVSKLNIKTSSIHQTVNNLSGGNQQKIVLAKWLETKPDILILDEPTRGIDVGAKREIYNIMRKLASEGVGIIMISSELPEVLFMSDRILIMRDKKIVKELQPSKTSQDEVMLYATGGR
ncbi:D-ribose transporter ATP-binding protein [Collibacillus ludicampi]|jgi:ribose transport system ATP-binding protein|uniref:D-ribose transporter ATP-binding protein n=1 Tax=Collibacillus ludicampi TaxID=2771369 RepID=A0AAV4LJL5_9BACL|nr:sugar ABC transporter ATP-binding protein [Collibacillus ludicampi]GIM47973.1 D-ribose transporter ATP-binding protein [Collibacillus ludicampi]